MVGARRPSGSNPQIRKNTVETVFTREYYRSAEKIFCKCYMIQNWGEKKNITEFWPSKADKVLTAPVCIVQCVQSRSVKNAIFYVMCNKQTLKCSCGTAQLHVACSDFGVELDLLCHWWLEVKSLQNLIYLFVCAFFESTSNFYIVNCKEIFSFIQHYFL